MKIMMVNVRGFKSKEISIREIIKEEQPTIVMFMETLCQENEEPMIEGYATKSMKKRSDEWGGILFAIKEELQNNVQVKCEMDSIAEMMFIQVICGRSTMTIGLIYAPQENQVTKEEIDKMYKDIEKEIIEARNNNHLVIIAGDLNCKIGEHVKGNKKEITKGGRRLLKMAKHNEMIILNTTDKCKGLWTRSQKEEKGTKRSVIDYVLVTEKHEEIVTKMEIDEERLVTPHRNDSRPGMEVYTDHNMITVLMNLQILKEQRQEKETTNITNKENKENFKKATQNSNLSEIWKKGDLSPAVRYTQWNEEVKNILKETCTTQKKDNKTECKEVRKMRNRRKDLKTQMNKEKQKAIKEKRSGQ